MQKHQVLHLIHGHTHRPAVHEFDLNGQPAVRTVLPAWHDRGCVLICDAAGKTRIEVLETE
jgi:UDP-2,3-diacylglucosamine hydrolase